MDLIVAGRLAGCPPLAELADQLRTAGLPVVEGRHALRCGDLVLRSAPGRPGELQVTGDHDDTQALVAQAARLSQALGTLAVRHGIDILGPEDSLVASFPAEPSRAR